MKLPFDGYFRRRLFLLRHGDAMSKAAAKGYADVLPLSERGVAQAQAMRDVLRPVRFDRAVSSDIQRSVETARIVLEGHDLVAEQRPILREIEGDITTVFNSDAPPERKARDFAYLMWNAVDPTARFFGGEAFGTFLARTSGAMEDLVLNSEGTNILVVSHSGLNRAALCWALGLPPVGMAALDQDTCCLNVVDVDIDLETRRILRKTVRMMNYTPLNHGKMPEILNDGEMMMLRFAELHAPAQH